jgi:hypothetical protein
MKIQPFVNRNPLFHLVLATGLVFAGCSSEKNNHGTAKSTDDPKTTTADAPVTSAAPSDTDTLNISGSTVVFFAPSESIIEILKAKEPKRNVAQELQQFSDAMKPVMDSLRTAGFADVQFTVKRYFRVTLSTGSEMKIDRYKLKSEFGMYMTDGIQPPAFKLGQLTSHEMHVTLKKFFNPKAGA